MKAKPHHQHPLFKIAGKHSTRPALICGEETLTYSELLEEAKQVASGFYQLGLREGQLIAIGDLSIREMIISLWACFLGGFIVFPLNIRFPATALAKILTDVKAKIIISKATYPDHKSVAFHELVRQAGELDNLDLPPFREMGAATLLMTSGSSGDVKFVQHSHHNHLESAKGSNQNIQLTSSDSWLLSLPLYHVGGLSILFRTLLSGSSVIIPEEEDSMLELIDNHIITHISLVPTQFQRLLKDQSGPRILHEMKAILIGGSAIPQPLLQEALSHCLPIYVSYGSTEMASQITTTTRSRPRSALENSGKVLSGRDVIISQDGEILTKGETLAQGYLTKTKLNDLRDNEGWFHTGDIGYMNVHGELTITGRMDNQFISGGENVQPEHIERLLSKIPGILHAIVVPRQDMEFGFRPVAYLEIDSQFLEGDEINSQLRNQLPGYMLPQTYYELPSEFMNTSMKISRQELIKLTRSGNISLHVL